MVRPSSPADHDREATQTGRFRTPRSASSSVALPEMSGHEGEAPTFKHDIINENAKSAERRRSSFIPNHTSKRYGTFAPANVVELATKTTQLMIRDELAR